MFRTAFILCVLATLAACKQKRLSLEELAKARWDSLDLGIDYIRMEDEMDAASGHDSVSLVFIGGTGKSVVSAESLPDSSFREFNYLSASLLKDNALPGKAGYLRINFYEMFASSASVRIYLKDQEDGAEYNGFSEDSATLMSMPGVRSIEYISKEAAKELFLANGNNDWEMILCTNPLPASIEIKLDSHAWTPELLENLENSIYSELPGADNVSYPQILFDYKDKYFYFEYRQPANSRHVQR